ncbi:MAG TPA: hypothetical protein EYN00_07885, partial [Planctomycetes bacterium]|nr:hypothetical protein [Planctomycetota bacterium]
MIDASRTVPRKGGVQLSVKQSLEIALSTARESWRQSFHSVLCYLGLAMVGLTPLISAFALGDEDLLLRDLGLSSLLLCGLLLSAFTASAALGEEIRSHTLVTVLSKPVSRTALILGKYIGIALALTTTNLIWALMLILAVEPDPRALLGGTLAVIGATIWAIWSNFERAVPFSASLHRSLLVLIPGAFLFHVVSTSGEGPIFWTFDWQLLSAILLINEATLLFAAIALAASTRLPQVATLAVTLLCFLLASGGDSLLGDSVIARLFPDLQRLWISDGLLR